MTNGTDPAMGYGFTTADGQSHVDCPGLSKREYFASMAMQGCLASGFETTMDKHAESAVTAADALIKALNND